MTTIKEDYCSFEVAKLLKENEFDEECRAKYLADGNKFNFTLFHYRNSDINENACSAPTHQMAMAWLREKHRLYIDINIEVGDIQMLPSYDFEEDVLGYSYAIYNEETLIWVFKDKTPRSYEKAVEAAIRYCLENLI